MKNIKNDIYIECKRWFQRSYGNTYFSVRIHLNDEEEKQWIEKHGNTDQLYIPFEYGYGEHCLDVARKKLEELGLIAVYENVSTWKVFKELEIATSIVDVDRKKEL